MPAVWTDSNERVMRVVTDEDSTDTTGATIVASMPGSPSPTHVWCESTLHYNSTDGFYYTETDPLSGLNLTDAEKNELFEAVTAGDLVKARELIETKL